ncbi:hypothetical protein BDA99DRAFT_576517 [Phascolomyces articulosus]|uniref:Nudix hydrolase domain-containing protein n=1 Tax=Phascolomyces articulosus TaxID=60185 RepID=A0AAD5JYF0_9FUNG|nr:hypothetical protein BDA99DRAFT_576517 [Phascolomyces articulosus]
MLSTSSPRRFSGFPLFNPVQQKLQQRKLQRRSLQVQQQQQQQLQLQEVEQRKIQQQQQQEKEKQLQQDKEQDRQEQAALTGPKKKKPIRQAIGIIITDSKTGKVLLLTSRKREGALVLPRGDRNDDAQETSEEAVIRILYEEAGIRIINQSPKRLGTYTEGNKRGKIIAHHWMYEFSDAKLIQSIPPRKLITNAEGEQVEQKQRELVWVPYNEALAATLDRPMSHLALKSSSFGST